MMNWLDTLSTRDLLIPRRMVPVVYALCFATVTLSTIIGFLGGYYMTDSRHATERRFTLGEYTRQLDVKDERINTITSQIIEAQEAMATRATRTDEMLGGVLMVLEQLADNVARNKANTRQLSAAAAELRRLRTAPMPVPKPTPRPHVGPPPQTPLAPARRGPSATQPHAPGIYVN